MAGLKKNLLISISTALLGVVVLFAFDTQIWISIKNLIPPDFICIPKSLTKWGLYVFYSIFAGLMIYALYKKDRKLKGIWWAYVKAQLIFSFGVVRCMKIFFGRARPKYGEYGGEFTFFSLDSHFNSFPSGHSADAFVSGVFLYYLLKYSKYSKYRFLPLAYALLIAFSRVVVSAHYLSDAVAGMAIGILGAYFFLSRQHKQPG